MENETMQATTEVVNGIFGMSWIVVAAVGAAVVLGVGAAVKGYKVITRTEEEADEIKMKAAIKRRDKEQETINRIAARHSKEDVATEATPA